MAYDPVQAINTEEPSHPEDIVDVTVIGAGPIGLELAVALKKAGVDYQHFEAGQIGQTVSRYPKMTRFFSSPDRIAIAGVPLSTHDQSKATREDYLAYLCGIVSQFDLNVQTFTRVERIEQDSTNHLFTLHVDRHGALRRTYTRRIVLAVGDLAMPKLLHIPGEDLPHVSHYFDEPHKYFRKKLLIVGGKNSAVEAAIRCHRAGAEVSMSYRQQSFDAKRVKYWLLPEIEALIKDGSIHLYSQTVPQAINRTHVTLTPAQPLIGDTTTVEADFVLLLTGYVMDSTLFEMLGVQLDGSNHAPTHDPTTMQTNIANVYVAGTAAAGTQETFRLFIENCHIHVPRIVASITGQPPPTQSENPNNTYTHPES